MTICIIPAAGKAERMNGIPKMLLPVPGGTLIERLIARMERVGQVIVGTRPVNYELLAGVCSATVFQTQTQTMSETVLRARSFVMPRTPVALGLPDTYFEDGDVFPKLVAELLDGADVAVACFRTRPEQRHKLGMVEIAGCDVLRVEEKPAQTALEWAWGALAWKPKFWDVISPKMPHVGYALPLALAGEMDVRAVRMNGGFWDCGTSDEYFALINHLTAVTEMGLL